MSRFAILSCLELGLWRATSKQVIDTTFTRVLRWTTSFVRSQSRENVKGTVDGFIELYLDTYGEASDTWEIFDVTPPCDDALL